MAMARAARRGPVWFALLLWAGCAGKNRDPAPAVDARTCPPDCTPCEMAAAARSYIGCDYWPTTTLTSQLNPYFDFAVAVANPAGADAAAAITVTRGAKTVATATVRPGAVETIVLPWVTALAQTLDCAGGGACAARAETSALVEDGAYHLVSSIPVTVYQFSPLQFEKPASPTCVDARPAGGVCHSFSNDASILLPTGTMKNEYIAIARQSYALDDGFGASTPGFVAIVGTADGTRVTVTSSSYTEAGPGAPAMAPGESRSFSLGAGDVLQLVSRRDASPCALMSRDASGAYCDLGRAWDLTGSRIVADKPIVVFGGHACSFVPYDRWACDHLEEQLTPLDTWGHTIAVAPTKPYTAANEPNVWRVISGGDGNRISFEPPAAHAPVTLDAGEFVEFTWGAGFRASGTGRLAIGQYMVGQNYAAASMQDLGDPSLGLGVPVEQWRDAYDFLAPSTYTENYATVIAPADPGGPAIELVLDGSRVALAPSPIDGTGLGWARLPLLPGAHHLAGAAKFGLTVTGIANYTSYLYVGGQNLDDVPVQ